MKLRCNSCCLHISSPIDDRILERLEDTIKTPRNQSYFSLNLRLGITRHDTFAARLYNSAKIFGQAKKESSLLSAAVYYYTGHLFRSDLKIILKNSSALAACLSCCW